mgnify:CR=1 FL=1
MRGADKLRENINRYMGDFDREAYRFTLDRNRMTEAEFEAILARQVPDSVKRGRADFVIDTGHGLEAARARGRKGGRKPTLGAKEIRDIKILLADPLTTVSDVAARFKVSRTTIYKYLSKEAQHVVQ